MIFKMLRIFLVILGKDKRYQIEECNTKWRKYKNSKYQGIEINNFLDMLMVSLSRVKKSPIFFLMLRK